jgi:hypothetical protein
MNSRTKREGYKSTHRERERERERGIQHTFALSSADMPRASILPSSHKLCNNLVYMAATAHLSDHKLSLA